MHAARLAVVAVRMLGKCVPKSPKGEQLLVLHAVMDRHVSLGRVYQGEESGCLLAPSFPPSRVPLA